mgnify:FL=1
MHKIRIVAILLSISTLSFAGNHSWKLLSPDKNIIMTIEQDSANQSLSYHVDIMSNTLVNVIGNSTLGIERNEQKFVNNLEFVQQSDFKTIAETYLMMIGRQSGFRNFANETSLTFKTKKGALLQLDCRVYNDGIAFRYVFPEKSDKKYTVKKELTSFRFSTAGKAWIQPYDKPTKWTPGYEKYYENAVTIGSASPNSEGWAFPALFEIQNVWALLTEANLDRNYCGSRLEQNADNGIYKIRFPEPKDGEGTGKLRPVSSLPWVMPWRTIIIGTSLNTIFNSAMVSNLADAPKPMDFSWVKPGKSSWSWLTDNNSPKNFETLKKYVDLSAEMHWEYCLVDANWDLMQGGNIKQLVDYATTKNIGILMWYNSGGKHNTVSERPRDIISDKNRCAAEFAKLKTWGVKGVKIDFWQSDKQNIIALYHDVLTLAAENHLLVNLHGCTLPRGWSRTYPNLISLEAVKGEEAYLFDQEYPEKAPVQNSILPFTRNVVGPMDYTPVVFSNLKNKHLTTAAHELALSIIFNSGVVHFADNEKSYRSLPAFVKDFLKNVPVTFDETILLEGYPGKHIIIAAQKGEKWFLAGINSKNESTNFSIQCKFLRAGNYTLKQIADGNLSSENKFYFKQSIISNNTELNIDFLPYGGFVAEIIAE